MLSSRRRRPGDRLGGGILAAKGAIRRIGVRSRPSAAVRDAFDHAERRDHRPEYAVQLPLRHGQARATRPWWTDPGREPPHRGTVFLPGPMVPEPPITR